MATVYFTCNATVADLPGVKAAVRQEGNEIKYRAESMLAGHRNTGNARITVEYSDKDVVVSLEDPGSPDRNNAVAIEFGHFHNWTGEYIPGLYILSAAAGLLE